MTQATPTLRMTEAMYRDMMCELADRGRGNRETGAFLLASRTRHDRLADILEAAYYDDLDPTSLTGGITFGAVGYSKLSTLCRDRELRAVADLHTHPGPWVQQSGIDSKHPMVGIPCHIAFIAPNYAAGNPSPSELGAHILTAEATWTSLYGDDVAAVLNITKASRVQRLIAALRCAARAASKNRSLTRKERP